MTRQHVSRASTTTPAQRVAWASAATAFAWVIISLPADAGAAASPRTAPLKVTRTRFDHHGNGRHNRNAISVRSPTHNRGYQHTNSSNAGGLNNVQNALCRHSTVCNVTQKVTIIRPEPVSPYPIRTVEPVSPETDAPVRPEDLDTALPEEPTPAVREPTVPPAAGETPPAATDPFLYLSPYGITMRTPASRMPFTFGTTGTIPSFAFPLGFFR
jgi:hypothetical protein